MDNQKIGRLIAEKRKLKQMTQRELAEKLHVTDKAVSKWENGKSMPDNGLLLPLCELLGMTVEELLAGEVNKSRQTPYNVKWRSVAGIMGIAGLIAFLMAVLQLSVGVKGSILSFIDIPSLCIIFGTVFLELLFAESVKPFFNAFVLIWRKNHVDGQMAEASLRAVRLAIYAIIMAGSLSFAVSIIVVLSNGNASGIFTGIKISAAFLSFVDSTFFLLILLPVKIRLEMIKAREFSD